MTIEDTEKSFQLDGIEKGIRTLWPSLTDIQETLLLSRMVVRQFNKQEVIYSARRALQLGASPPLIAVVTMAQMFMIPP